VTRRKPADVAGPLAAVLLLLAPALWNGFPLLEYDTGGYLARWFEGTLEVSRSSAYGLFLVALARPDFWPAVVVQAALAVWVIALVLRAHGLGRPLVFLITVAGLSVATTLPWITSILLTDIFAGLGVLALYLVLLRGETLTGFERAALVVLAAFSGATHNATLAVELALVVAATAAALFRRGIVPSPGLRRGIAVLALGPIMLVAANYVVAGQLAWTPGGIALSFGRILQDGIVARFLADHCPDPRFKLCDYRDELPTDADDFFWDNKSVFERLGRFQGLNDEMRSIVLASLRDYPLRQIEAAAIAASRQLVAVRTGEGANNSLWHTYRILEKFTPSTLPAMRAARQQNGELDFSAINRLHVPVALASMALLLIIIALAIREERFADLGPLAAAVAIALLANAVVCGVFANPHDRYGARLVWIAPFVVALVLWRCAASRRRRQRMPDWRRWSKTISGRRVTRFPSRQHEMCHARGSSTPGY
jgi:hypothetical protein